jgi:hypothetical protein
MDRTRSPEPRSMGEAHPSHAHKAYGPSELSESALHGLIRPSDHPSHPSPLSACAGACCRRGATDGHVRVSECIRSCASSIGRVRRLSMGRARRPWVVRVVCVSSMGRARRLCVVHGSCASRAGACSRRGATPSTRAPPSVPSPGPPPGPGWGAGRGAGSAGTTTCTPCRAPAPAPPRACPRCLTPPPAAPWRRAPRERRRRAAGAKRCGPALLTTARQLC